MKYVVKPSLEHIALVKIVVTLWDQNDVRALIAKLSSVHFGDKSEEWQKIEDKISEKVSQLSLPQTLKMKLLGFIKPIGFQILEWMRYHRRGFYLHLDLPAKLYWLTQGTVDRKRTAEVLIEDENLHVATRYKLACMYCLEDDITKLWYQMPENLKGCFLHDYCLEKANWQTAVCLWTCNRRRGELANAQTHTSYKYAFEYSARVGNKAAVEYFLQKLTPREREESLLRMAKRVRDADLLCFLLSELDEEEQIKVLCFLLSELDEEEEIKLVNHPFVALECFLNWPLQSLFIEIANHMLDIFSKDQYIYLLKKIIDKVESDYKDWNYKKLFSEFWQKSPVALKSFTADEFDNGWLKSTLFKIKDKETLSLILEDVSLTEKNKLIYSDNAQNYCQNLIFHGQWDSLEYFIKACLPSEDERMKFKEVFEKKTKLYFEPLTWFKLEWNPLFLLSDDSISKYNKRSVEEGQSSSCKRLCDLQ